MGRQYLQQETCDRAIVLTVGDSHASSALSTLSHHALVTPVAGQAQCTQQCPLTRSTRLASRLSGHGVMKQCGLAGLCFGGRTALGSRLSQVHMGVVAMGQDCNYQLDTTKLEKKKKEVTLGVCGIWPIYLHVALCLRTALGRGILAIYHTSLGLIS